MTLLFTILVTFFAGMGAGLGTGFAGMSAAAVISPMLITFLDVDPDRKSTRLNSSHMSESRMPSSA